MGDSGNQRITFDGNTGVTRISITNLVPSGQKEKPSCNMNTITYHLSKSALMLAQAAGTVASAGTAAVSESDMSVVVVMCGFNGLCPVPVHQMPMDPHCHRQRERGTEGAWR